MVRVIPAIVPASIIFQCHAIIPADSHNTCKMGAPTKSAILARLEIKYTSCAATLLCRITERSNHEGLAYARLCILIYLLRFQEVLALR